MYRQPKFSPRASRARSIRSYFPFFLCLPLFFAILTTDPAIAEPVHLEFGAGIMVPSDAFPYEDVGPEFTIGLRKRLSQFIDVHVTTEVNHARFDPDKLTRLDQSGYSGGRQTLVLGALNIGTHFEASPNLFVGIGGGYFTWTDFIAYYPYGRKDVHRRGDTVRLAYQAGVRFDFVETSVGNIYGTARAVRTSLFDYFPITLGFRFQ